MLTQSKRITQIDCIIFLRFWLAQIIYILVLVSITNTQAAVIQKREIPTSYPQKEVSDTSLAINKEINRHIEINEPKLITTAATEFPLNNETYKNDSRKLGVLLSKTTYKDLLNNSNGSNIETTTSGDRSVTELSYNDINAKNEVVNVKSQSEHVKYQKEEESKQSKEALKIFDNDVLQILGAISKKDLTTKSPFLTEDTTKNSNQQVKYKAPSVEQALEIKTPSPVNSVNGLDEQQPITDILTSTREPPSQVIHSVKDIEMKIHNNVQDNIDREELKNSKSNKDTVTEIIPIQTAITEDILFGLDNIQGLTTLPTIAITTNNLDSISPTNSILNSINQTLKNRQDHPRDRSLDIYDNFTLQISRNVNENEILSTAATITKLGTEYMASKKKYAVAEKSTTEKTTTATGIHDDSNIEKRGKYIDNNSTITQQINLPSAAEIWTLVGMKAVSKINDTMGTAHEHFPKVNKNDQQSTTLNGGRNSEKAILDWTQIMSTNELMDKKIKEITTERNVVISSIRLLSTPAATSTTPIPKIISNEVPLNATTTSPTNVLRVLLNNGESSQYNNTLPLSAIQNIKRTNLSISDNSKEQQITSPISLEKNIENFIETNIETTTFITPTSQTDTEIEIDIETETETETALTTLSTEIQKEMRLSEENEITIHPPTTSAEKAVVTQSKVEKVEQQNNDVQLQQQQQQKQQQQMYFESDANTTTKNIVDDAAEAVLITTTTTGTITASTSADTFTLEPTVSETTTFSTLITGEASTSVSPPVFIIDTSTQNNFINNQNNNSTTIKLIETNQNNAAAPTTNSPINNVNKVYQEGTTDIDQWYTNETNLEKTEKNRTINLGTSFIETVNATSAPTTATTIENNFNSSTLETHLITQEAEKVEAVATTTTPIATDTITTTITANSDEYYFLTLPAVTEREVTITTIAQATPAGNESTSFPETKTVLINQDNYNNENTGEERNENITINVPTLNNKTSSSALNTNGIQITTQSTPLTTTTTTIKITKPINIITTTTEKTPVASSNNEQSPETSIETNIIDNNNTEAKEDNADIGKTITYTTTPITLAKSVNVTESDYNKPNSNDNILTMTTVSSVIATNNITTSQIHQTPDVGHSDLTTTTSTATTITTTTATAKIITTITTPNSDVETTLSSTRLIPNIEGIHNVIQHSTTEKSIQETTKLSQSTTLSTNQQNFIESSTSRNIKNTSSIKESVVLPRPTNINIYQTDTNGNVDGNGESGNEIDNDSVFILPTLRTIENDGRHLFPSKGSNTTDETDVNVIIAITVSVIGVVALVLLVAFLYLMRKRQKSSSYSQRCRPVSLDDYTIDSTSIYNSMRFKGNTVRASKRSHANLAFDDPSLRHNVLDVNELSKFLQDKCSIYEEFRDVPQVRARVDEVPTGCEDKNRYANVVPLPETRVMLQRLNDDAKTEYINANYVRGPKDATKYYIACQAPLDSTIEDFWRMIWEQKSRVIIQATDLVENGVEKCAEYLPPSMTLDNHTTFGEFQVTLHHREVKDKYATSIILLKHMGENVTREITHYWYKWPEVGVPVEEAPIIAMLLEARSSLISYAIEYANEIKEDSSTITLKSTDDSSAATINSANGQTKDKESTNNTMNNTEEINGNISMVHIRKKTAKYQGPLTVHCSPGTGRTGTIIACDIAIRSLEMPKRTVDIPQIVYYVRHGRASSVLTKEQYEFIYKIANMYATKISNPSNDN